MSEAIFAMVHAARKSNSLARTVLIGHSFGALILEKVLAQALPAATLEEVIQRSYRRQT
jgi:type IV secretory pathway VirJ component